MYGLTEAFRATYLPPEEVDRRPDSIGKAIPNSRDPRAARRRHAVRRRRARRTGAARRAGGAGLLERSGEDRRALSPAAGGAKPGCVLPEIAVFSGDTVRRDEEGFLYFIGRRDEMIKSSGYRISPTEVEEVLYATRLVGECAAFGVPHPTLGEAVVVDRHAAPTARRSTSSALLALCRERLPAYMVPAQHRAARSGRCRAMPTARSIARLIAAEYACQCSEGRVDVSRARHPRA